MKGFLSKMGAWPNARFGSGPFLLVRRRVTSVDGVERCGGWKRNGGRQRVEFPLDHCHAARSQYKYLNASSLCAVVGTRIVVLPRCCKSRPRPVWSAFVSAYGKEPVASRTFPSFRKSIIHERVNYFSRAWLYFPSLIFLPFHRPFKSLSTSFFRLGRVVKSPLLSLVTGQDPEIDGTFHNIFPATTDDEKLLIHIAVFIIVAHFITFYKGPFLVIIFGSEKAF